VLDDEWVRQWARDIDDAMSTMTATFEVDHGYPPGVNEVRWADADDRADAERYGHDAMSSVEMTAFYQVVAEVSLPDVGNGVFVHSAASALALRDEVGYAYLPAATDHHGLVIGSTGGGTQFVQDWGGRVHRSVGASLEGDFKQVADSAEQFLEHLRHAVTEFVTRNEVMDLDNW
jgi:hypothetical protein